MQASPNVIPKESPTVSPINETNASPNVSPEESPTVSPVNNMNASPTVSPEESPTIRPVNENKASPTVSHEKSPTASPLANAIAHTISGIDVMMTHVIDSIHLMLEVAIDDGTPNFNFPSSTSNEIASLSPIVDSSSNGIASLFPIVDSSSKDITFSDNIKHTPVPTELLLMMHDAEQIDYQRNQRLVNNDKFSHVHEHVFHHLQSSTKHILQNVHEYRLARNDLLLMLRDHLHDDNERTMRAMDYERNSDTKDALRLKLQGQCAHDDELCQLQDDVLHHINSTIDQIIDTFANISHDSSDSYPCHMCEVAHIINDDCFNGEPTNDFNEARDWWVEPPDSSEGPSNSVDDDLTENTDTDDGAEDIVALIQANIKLLIFLRK